MKVKKIKKRIVKVVENTPMHSLGVMILRYNIFGTKTEDKKKEEENDEKLKTALEELIKEDVVEVDNIKLSGWHKNSYLIVKLKKWKG